MNALEITIVTFAIAAGILTATFVTLYGLLHDARERRDRQLFDAYVHDRLGLETWLARGALEQIQRAFTPDSSGPRPRT